MATGTGPVLVIGEVDSTGAPRPVAFEMIAVGRQVADGFGVPLAVLVMGADLGVAAAAVGESGVDRLLVADDAVLANLNAEAATTVLCRVIADLDPTAVLMPGTTAGRDYAPRVAARLRVGLVADCIELSVDDGNLVAIRPILGGRVQVEVRLPAGRTRLATVHPGAFAAATATAAVSAPTPEPVTMELGDLERRVQMRGIERAASAGAANLERATVVVGGGRGLKEAANFRLVEDLASALGGVVGATRAVTDAGWRPHHEQIGQTGRTIAPRLYVGVGVSGAVQHLVGIQGSEFIVAINRDPDAPIFKIASFGIVGDLFEVVPAVVAALK